MKNKLFGSFSTIIFVSVLLVSSCGKKDNHPIPDNTGTSAEDNARIKPGNAYKLSVADNMLVFGSSKDYKKVIGGLNKEQKLEFLNYLSRNIDFNSLAKHKDSKLYKELNDDFIELLINHEGYIRIGKNVFKLDPFSQSVIVIDYARFNANLKAQLDAETYTNPDIKVYSMLDDVLGMIDTNTPPSSASLFCGESGAGGDQRSGHIDCTNPSNGSSCNWMDCWVDYNAFGIYFALKAKCVNTSPCREMVWHKTPAGFKVKCGYTLSPQYQWDIRTNSVGSSGWVWNNYFYQNVQPLNAFWLRVVFMAKDPNWIGNPDNPSVDLEIRKNM